MKKYFYIIATLLIIINGLLVYKVVDLVKENNLLINRISNLQTDLNNVSNHNAYLNQIMATSNVNNSFFINETFKVLEVNEKERTYKAEIILQPKEMKNNIQSAKLQIGYTLYEVIVTDTHFRIVADFHLEKRIEGAYLYIHTYSGTESKLSSIQFNPMAELTNSFYANFLGEIRLDNEFVMNGYVDYQPYDLQNLYDVFVVTEVNKKVISKEKLTVEDNDLLVKVKPEANDFIQVYLTGIDSNGFVYKNVLKEAKYDENGKFRTQASYNGKTEVFYSDGTKIGIL